MSQQLNALRRSVEAAKKVQDALKKAGEETRTSAQPPVPPEKGKLTPIPPTKP